MPEATDETSTRRTEAFTRSRYIAARQGLNGYSTAFGHRTSRDIRYPPRPKKRCEVNKGTITNKLYGNRRERTHKIMHHCRNVGTRGGLDFLARRASLISVCCSLRKGRAPFRGCQSPSRAGSSTVPNNPRKAGAVRVVLVVLRGSELDFGPRAMMVGIITVGKGHNRAM